MQQQGSKQSIWKMGKRFKQTHITKEDTHVAYKDTKQCSIPNIIRESQIKTMRNPCSLVFIQPT